MAEGVLELPDVKVEIKEEHDDCGSLAEDLDLQLENLVSVDVDNLGEAKVKVEDAIISGNCTSGRCLPPLPQNRLGMFKKNNHHECEVCGFKSKTEKGLKVHKQRLLHRLKLHCNICNEGFARLLELQKHRRDRHSNEKPFVCDVCGRSYAYKYNLFTHVKTAHLGFVPQKKVHACKLCEKVYSYPRSLRLHMTAHLGTNVFICDICGKSLTNKDHLKFHRRIHTGEKPYVCETCGKGFCKSCNLTLHRRVHTGERPYKCDSCKKAFSQRSTLVIHMRVHSGQKPYVCFVCQRAFICRALLNVHLKNHSV